MIEWIFKPDAEPQGSSDGFWYDVTDGGYVKPEAVLADGEQVRKVKDAIDLLVDFKLAMEKKGLVIEY